MSESDQIDRANRATAIAKAKRAAAEARAAEAKAVAAERLLDPPPTPEPEVLPWERRPGETVRAFRAFGIYLRQDKRSIRRAAKVARTSYQAMTKWSKANEWVSRVGAWDDHLASIQATAAEATARTTGETIGLSLAAGLEVTRLAFSGYLEDPSKVGDLKFADLVHALEQLAKLDELLAGRATERVESSAPTRSRADLLSDLWGTDSGRALLAEAKATKAKGSQKGIA